MDHPLGVEPPGGGGHRLARGQPVGQTGRPQPPARLEELRPARPVDRPVDTAPAEQAGVRGVDDGVCTLLGDVPDGQGDGRVVAHDR
ncbi:hypothetical protein SDC9_204493 [bioreactor metagenome]|uniref:Uncharacterized protein n=1 Tax=bioreactor metagenome TaxID=1076179 RepID=A0A645IZQ2_9ZZZZ